MDNKNMLYAPILLSLALILSSGCLSGSNNVPPVSSGDVSGAADGNNRFALDYYSKTKDSGGNVFFSPWSISSALAMTYEGARGKTADEMASVMHFQTDSDLRRSSFSSLYDSFNSKDAGYVLSTANALWVQKDYQLLKDYTGTVETYYRGAASNVDYGNTEEARQTINAWVEDKTNSKIKDLIPQGVLDEKTKLVLTNAVYFKGIWVKEFNKGNTREENFRTEWGKNVVVQMMQRTDENSTFGYAETQDLQILDMPYNGGKISMMILLPRQDNQLPSLEKTLTAENLRGWKSDLKEQRVDVYIPKFKFDTKYFMAKDLRDMGMNAAFSAADFSGMTGQKDLSISEVIHQAYVEVNEEGTEAAAATAVIMKESASPYERPSPTIPVFRANHPFIFLIQDKETGAILFMGKMSDPGNAG